MRLELLSFDINIIDRWQKILRKYNPIIVEDILDEDVEKIVVVDFDNYNKETINFLKNYKKSDIKLIALQGYPKFEIGKILLKLGVKGYGNSFMLPKHLISCVEVVLSGNIWVYPDFIYNLIDNFGEKNAEIINKEVLKMLTPKEKEIVLDISNGLTNIQIASKRNITLQTVKVHLSKIYRKLSVSNRLELATLIKK